MSRITDLATAMIRNNPNLPNTPWTQAYVVPNPNCCYNYGNFGFNNGCGCNNGCC